MKPLDAQLLALAAAARVKPPHVYWCLAALKASKAPDIEALAHFSGLEVRHVERIVDALTSKGLLESPARASTRLAGRRLATSLLPDFIMPDNWIMWAREQRFWSAKDASDEAEQFKDYWISTGKAMVAWQATWRNWVRRSKRPNGTHSPVAKPKTPEDQIAYLEGVIDLYERQGRGSETLEWQDRLARLKSNVVPIRKSISGG